MRKTSNVSNTPFDGQENDLMLGNAPLFFERRNVLKTIAGSVVMVAAEVSGAHGAFNAPIPLDQISSIQEVVNGYGPQETENEKFDVRESYGLVRSVFGGTIGRTADYYGVSRKTIYQWINSESVPSLQSRQVERATLLASTAKHVRSKLGIKAKEYTKNKVDSLSLDEILVAESIDTDQLRVWVDGILEQVKTSEQANLSFADRLQKKGFSPLDGEDDLEPLI